MLPASFSKVFRHGALERGACGGGNRKGLERIGGINTDRFSIYQNDDAVKRSHVFSGYFYGVRRRVGFSELSGPGACVDANRFKLSKRVSRVFARGYSTSSNLESKSGLDDYFSYESISNRLRLDLASKGNGVVIYPALDTNYAYIFVPQSLDAVAIDSPDAEALISLVEGIRQNGINIRLSALLNTHGHPDHAEGNSRIMEEVDTIIQVVAPEEKNWDIKKTDEALPGEHIFFTDTELSVLDLSGHTMNHVGFHFFRQRAVFCGDALFPLGCGRIFEGTTKKAFNACKTIANLPLNTSIYSGHEYALSNLAFALSVDPNNEKLIARGKKLRQMRENGIPTVPSTVLEELETNPFLTLPTTTLDPEFMSQNHDNPVAIFSELRRLKDNFTR